MSVVRQPGSPVVLLLGLSLAGLSLAGPACAQEDEQPVAREGARQVYAETFRSEAASLEGKEVDLRWVKFLRVFPEEDQQLELKLYFGLRDGKARPSPLQGLLVVQDEKLAALLRDNKDSQGKKLEPRKSLIQVLGTIGKGKTGGPILLVKEVRRLISTVDRFTQQAQTLPVGDAQARADLISRIQSAVRGYPEEQKAVAGLLQTLRKEAREIEVTQLPELPGGAADWIDIGLRRRDVDRVSDVWSHPQVPAALKEKAEAVLRDRLGARLYLGRWYPPEELKPMLGFAQDPSGQWVLEERVWLQEAAEREKAKLRNDGVQQSVTQELLMEAMANGKVLRGMSKKMVTAACSKGIGVDSAFPVHVERYRELTPNRAELVFELWVMKNGLKVYFHNGRVTETEKVEE